MKSWTNSVIFLLIVKDFIELHCRGFSFRIWKGELSFIVHLMQLHLLGKTLPMKMFPLRTVSFRLLEQLDQFSYFIFASMDLNIWRTDTNTIATGIPCSNYIKNGIMLCCFIKSVGKKALSPSFHCPVLPDFNPINPFVVFL